MKDITTEEIKKGIEIAKEYRANAFTLKYKPKGACIITESGEYFGGCNIESNVSGLGLCAERCAVDHAVLHGKYRFKAIVICDERVTYPCGVCLQYMCLFTQINNVDLQIISARSTEDYTIYRFKELLPMDYISKSNEEVLEKYRMQ